MNFSDQANCEREPIAAYLDGELSGGILADFETHLDACSACRSELRNQQQLLCTLDTAFGDAFDLPEDFTRMVKARAESDVRGVREKHERRRAFQLTIILALLSFAFLGTAWQGSVLQPLRTTARVTLSVLNLAWQTISDAATGIVVIARLSGQALIVNPHRPGLFLLLIFLASVSLLPFLITRYHQRQTIE